MHRSRLANLVIDCSVEDIDAAAAFWSSALGKAIVPPSADSGDYRELASKIDEPMILLQKVDHFKSRAPGYRGRRSGGRGEAPRETGRQAGEVRQTLVGDGGSDGASLLRRSPAARPARCDSKKLGRPRRAVGSKPAVTSVPSG